MMMSRNLSSKVVLLVISLLTLSKLSRSQDSPPTGSSLTTENEDNATTASPSNLLCDKLADVLDEIQIQNGRTCLLNSACNGLECRYDLYSMRVWVLPCAESPAIRLSIFNDEPFDDVLINTTRVQGLGYAIQVTFVHQDGGFELEISDENIGNLVPPTMFSTDPSYCSSSVCNAIHSAISRPTAGTTCSLTKQCDGARCVRNLGIKINANLRIVQCHHPPAVQLTVENPFNEKDRDLVNDLFTSTSNRSVLNFYDMFVTVHQLGSGIGVEITGQIRGSDPDDGGETPTDTDYPFYGSGSGFPFGSGFPLPGSGLPFPDDGSNNEEVDGGGDSILEYTFFPVDPSRPECEVFSLTCLGLLGVIDKAATSNVSCQTNPKCNGVLCFVDAFQNGVLFPLSIVFNTCKQPMPSVNLVLMDPDSRILLRRELDRSDTINLFNHDIIVTVEHFPADEKPYPSIGFAIDLVLSSDNRDAASEPMKIIRYSEVPIVCDGTTGGVGSLTTTYQIFVLTLSLVIILLL